MEQKLATQISCAVSSFPTGKTTENRNHRGVGRVVTTLLALESPSRQELLAELAAEKAKNAELETANSQLAEVSSSNQAKIARLRNVCREMNKARHEIARQVDGLCDDLSNAYSEMADQMSEVAFTSEFRTILKQELDVEDLIRTMLEYMLIKTGPTNAAVFLPSDTDAQEFGLGGYVNYDCPRESITCVLDALCDALCKKVLEDDDKEMFSVDGEHDFSAWTGSNFPFAHDKTMVIVPCIHKNKVYAILLLFRSKNVPFTSRDASSLGIIREIFAEQLLTVVKVHQRARPSWPDEAKDGDLDEGYNSDADGAMDY